MFEDAIRLNANHGRALSPFDRTHCILRAEELEIEVAELASCLSMTVEAVGEMRVERVGKLKVAGVRTPQDVAIKRTIAHMAGKQLRARQYEANDRLGGMNQLFYVNQVIELLEADLLDTSNEQLMERLELLGNGQSWTRHAKGFPSDQGWFTVFRQAMKSDAQNPVGLYLGTTTGEIWVSRDEGESWKSVATHLPRILSIEVVER